MRIKFWLSYVSILLLSVVAIGAQEALTILECREAALKERNLEGERSAFDNYVKAKRRYLSTLNLPNAFAFGLFTAQSDVSNPNSALEFAFDFTPMSKYQYRSGVAIKQRLFDGGEVREKRLSVGVEKERRESELYREQLYIEEGIDNLYFSILGLEKEAMLLKNHHSTIKKRCQDLKSLYHHGKVMVTDLLKGELACEKLESKIEENRESIKAAKALLSVVTGIEITERTQFSEPLESEVIGAIEDPLYSDLEVARKVIDGAEGLSKVRVMPSLDIFGIGGVANPALDFFDNSSRPYAILGLSLKVPITSWRDHKRYKSLLNEQRKALNLAEEGANLKREALLSSANGEVDKLGKLLEKGEVIYQKQVELSDRYKELYEVGEASFSDYSDALSEMLNCQLEIEALKLKLLRAKISANRIVTELDLGGLEWNRHQ